MLKLPDDQQETHDDDVVNKISSQQKNRETMEVLVKGKYCDMPSFPSAAETSSRRRSKMSSARCSFSDAAKDAEERSASMRKLMTVIFLCTVFMAVEVIGGIKAHSLAILTDAAHLLFDVAAYGISLFALWAAGWKATKRHSFGFFRIEILCGLVSILMIWVLAGILMYEAIERIVHHESGEVQGFLMLLVSAFGFLVNIVIIFLLGRHDHKHSDDFHHHHRQQAQEEVELKHIHEISIPANRDAAEVELNSVSKSDNLTATNKVAQYKEKNINVQGAYLHALGDCLQSFGVMASGGAIWFKPQWKILDPICTLGFSLLVVTTTFRTSRNIFEVLMESTPRGVDATGLEKGLSEMDEVVAVNELHIWAITNGKVSLTCHLMIEPDADADKLLQEVAVYIKMEHNISHITIQIEHQKIEAYAEQKPELN